MPILHINDLKFNKNHLLKFLSRDQNDGTIHMLSNGCIKAFMIDSIPTLVQINFENNTLRYEVIYGFDTNFETIEKLITHWLDLDHDLIPFYMVLDKTEIGKNLLKQTEGFRLISLPTLFEALSWSIIGQQINITFAIELKRRFVMKYGRKITNKDVTLYTFPDIKDLSTLTEQNLLELRFGKYKSRYIINAINFLLSENVKALYDMKDVELFKVLTAIKGIGEWSAQYVMLKHFKRYDLFPYKDVGLQNALARLISQKEKPSRDKIDELIHPWKPYRGYAAQYLYLSLAY